MSHLLPPFCFSSQTYLILKNLCKTHHLTLIKHSLAFHSLDVFKRMRRNYASTFHNTYEYLHKTYHYVKKKVFTYYLVKFSSNTCSGRIVELKAEIVFLDASVTKVIKGLFGHLHIIRLQFYSDFLLMDSSYRVYFIQIENYGRFVTQMMLLVYETKNFLNKSNQTHQDENIFQLQKFFIIRNSSRLET